MGGFRLEKTLPKPKTFQKKAESVTVLFKKGVITGLIGVRIWP